MSENKPLSHQVVDALIHALNYAQKVIVGKWESLVLERNGLNSLKITKGSQSYYLAFQDFKTETGNDMISGSCFDGKGNMLWHNESHFLPQLVEGFIYQGLWDKESDIHFQPNAEFKNAIHVLHNWFYFRSKKPFWMSFENLNPDYSQKKNSYSLSLKNKGKLTFTIEDGLTPKFYVALDNVEAVFNNLVDAFNWWASYFSEDLGIDTSVQLDFAPHVPLTLQAICYALAAYNDEFSCKLVERTDDWVLYISKQNKNNLLDIQKLALRYSSSEIEILFAECSELSDLLNTLAESNSTFRDILKEKNNSPNHVGGYIPVLRSNSYASSFLINQFWEFLMGTKDIKNCLLGTEISAEIVARVFARVAEKKQSIIFEKQELEGLGQFLGFLVAPNYASTYRGAMLVSWNPNKWFLFLTGQDESAHSNPAFWDIRHKCETLDQATSHMCQYYEEFDVVKDN